MSTQIPVSPFTPQNDIPLSVFLKICNQNEESPAPSHDTAWHHEELQAYQNVITHVHTKQRKSVRILEVGCGTGRIGPYLAELTHVEHYTGIDVVPEYLEYFKRHTPTLTLCNQDIFKLEEECRFDIVLLPFTTLHLFVFPLQEALIAKLLRNHTKTACFDVMLPDWGGITERFTWKQTIQVGDFITTKESYALVRSDYYRLAEKLGTSLKEHEYYIRNTDGTLIRHAVLTFFR